LLYSVFFAFLFCSCDLLLEIGGDDSGGINNPVNVPPRKFWAQNLLTNAFYQLDAELLAESKNCRVWAEKGSGVSAATATSMAKAYEDEILPKMLNAFAYNGPIREKAGGPVIANNTLELAGWITGGDGKLTILLLDIKDDYKPRENEAYFAGYFWNGNFFERDPSNAYLRYSNETSMIYVDIYPGEPGTEGSNTTVAHELQHLMSFTNNFIIADRQGFLDAWIDEGLSSAAEQLYLGRQVNGRVDWYNNDRSGLIQKGNNFFIWGNRENENQYANLDDYSTVYLFFQWLRLQSGSTGIYTEITLSDYYNHLAVTDAANRAMSGNGYNNWETLLKTWLAANYINASSGPYGYRNDSTLKNIRAKTMPSGVMNVSLAPGEGVYSMTDNFAMPSNRQNIRYAGLNKAGNNLSDTATFSGGALLTYNANTNIEGRTESGTTTGVASYEAADIDDALARSAVGIGFSGPFVIDARDVLRRNGFERELSFELNKLKKGFTILE
jgi:hypothetical protein